MRNKKGMLVVEAVFMGLFFSAFVAAGITRPGHIVKRANEKCVYFGEPADVCSQRVEDMSQADRIAYIRDTVESPSDVWMK